ncbi:GpE family phage tail protein [Avibacterium paragallinarum]|nr:GpE family phage tail protein [Avibacterium paragallinarum]RZN51776.1 GpE family phage tail protein [Avibacterium paragallinarum]TID19276.1 phage tail protein [Avibacterium paragallinarum]
MAWWFGWGISELEQLYLDDLDVWLTQAERQIKAGYTKAAM